MTVLIPVTSTNTDECIIASMDENSSWAFVKIEEGKIQKIEFFNKREEILEWIDAVVVISDQEYVWPFMDEGIIALVAPTQRSIDEIIEGFLFKDLHDFSI